MENVDFVRAVCTVGIICFHFACYWGGNGTFVNGDWGHVLVTIFFMISGGMLYSNYKVLTSVREFYYKRFKSIFPSFYLSFLCFFGGNVIVSKKFFYKTDVNPFSILLTILGLDGYFYYAIPNYYILGEWFLGAIILLYLLYPILLYGFKRNKWMTVWIIVGLFCSVVFYNVFSISQMRNLFTCMFSFCVGMLLFDYLDFLKNKVVIAISGVIILFLFFVEVKSSCKIVIEIVFGICSFIVLFNMGAYFVKVSIIRNVILHIAKISFQIFLLQNVLIVRVLDYFYPSSSFSYWFALGFTIVFIIVCATILNKLVHNLLTSTVYGDFERYILK